jgi:hypothetical protein
MKIFSLKGGVGSYLKSLKIIELNVCPFSNILLFIESQFSHRKYLKGI